MSRSQPRVPAGSSRGGEFTSYGAGGGSSGFDLGSDRTSPGLRSIGATPAKFTAAQVADMASARGGQVGAVYDRLRASYGSKTSYTRDEALSVVKKMGG